MNHADALAHLEDYFDGTLSPDVHREIEAHLAGCTRCRDELSSLGALLDTVAEMRGKRVEPSRDLWLEIAAQIARDPRSDAGLSGDLAGERGRGGEADDWNPFRGVFGSRRARWPWLAGAAGLAVAALLLIALFAGKDGRPRLAGGAGGADDNGVEPGVPASSATVAADGANGVMTRELAMLDAQVASSRRNMRPVEGDGTAGTGADAEAGGKAGAPAGVRAGTAVGAEAGRAPGSAPGSTAGTTAGSVTDTTAATPSWRVFDQGLAVLDSAIKDSRAALERDPNNPVLQKSLLAAYQKQLELIRWANRVVRQS